MTIKKCKEYCRENGWSIAGVENSKECFCGDKAPTKRIPEFNCNKPCSGGKNEICGGAWALNIFELPG